MKPATEHTAAQQSAHAEAKPGEDLFQQLLGRPANPTEKSAWRSLSGVVEQVEQLLPQSMRGQGERLVRTAKMTYANKQDLQKYDPSSFVRTVIDAARYGLAIDNRMAYAYPFNNTVKDENGRESKVMELTLNVSYRGLVSIARRNGTITDARARLVYEGEEFKIGTVNGQDVLEHSQNPDGGKVDDIRGAYCIVNLPGGDWKYTYMPIDQIYERHRKRSQSFKSGYGSPWKSDPESMILKTVVRVAMNLHTDDPNVQGLIATEDQRFSTLNEQAEEGEALPSLGEMSSALADGADRQGASEPTAAQGLDPLWEEWDGLREQLSLDQLASLLAMVGVDEVVPEMDPRRLQFAIDVATATIDAAKY